MHKVMIKETINSRKFVVGENEIEKTGIRVVFIDILLQFDLILYYWKDRVGKSW